MQLLYLVSLLKEGNIARAAVAVMVVIAVIVIVVSAFLSPHIKTHGNLHEQEFVDESGKRGTCTAAAVVWMDAAHITGELAKDYTNDLARTTSYGCVDVREKAVIVIHGISEGKVAEFTIVPKGWIVNIVFLKSGTDTPLK